MKYPKHILSNGIKGTFQYEDKNQGHYHFDDGGELFIKEGEIHLFKQVT